ncbi:unnamed protein product [Schistosoma curassoni]|uniref:Uncharacterized protein n=1 Tax=Schistosoma curassoni TaxID=6186 RepID=A0A3P8DQF2_9TREM|nr:unnamed protein product [Schistosoma curassoni]
MRKIYIIDHLRQFIVIVPFFSLLYLQRSSSNCRKIISGKFYTFCSLKLIYIVKYIEKKSIHFIFLYILPLLYNEILFM